MTKQYYLGGEKRTFCVASFTQQIIADILISLLFNLTLLSKVSESLLALFPSYQQYADEEAQLLQREELDFEDNTAAQAGFRIPQSSGLHGRLKGPDPPRIQTITPFFAQAQEFLPTWLNQRFPERRQRALLLSGVLGLWLIAFIISLSAQFPVTDSTGRPVTNLDCVDTLWRPKNECGIDGINCHPFSNSSFSFKCPAKCASVKVLNPRAVGPVDVNYRPLVIGDGTYRGDSFICASTIHAGVMTDNGGCGRVTLLGRRDNFSGTERHGIESIPFDSYFPLAFAVSSDSSITCSSDPRNVLLFLDILVAALLSIFGASPTVFFPIFVIIFAHVAFASDPPSASYRNTTVLPDHIASFAKRLLPALFCAVVIYRTTVRRTLHGLTAHVEKTFLWLGGFFFGALSNYTFDWIPIQRLTAHDLEQQPGAKFALAIILVVLVAIIAGQIYYFWLEGRLLRYLALYGLFISGILVCLTIPGVSLRIHHYIIGLLLLPGTSIKTRPSLVYQGILLGLFVNGIARWDFDSVLQTTADLRGDGKFDSALPELLEPGITNKAGVLVANFQWVAPPAVVDGISVLVNDVERSRQFFSDAEDGAHGFEWTRTVEESSNEYFRFGYVKGGRTLDYTKAGTLFGNGTWSGTW
ncbi:LCCL domain containing protein [Paraphaeosphaeria sporulosa]